MYPQIVIVFLPTQAIISQAVNEFILELGLKENSSKKQCKITVLALNDEEWTCVHLFCNILHVTDSSMTLACKVGLGLQDLQKRGQRILAERNAEKAEENTWIGQMVAAKSIGELDRLIRSCAT